MFPRSLFPQQKCVLYIFLASVKYVIVRKVLPFLFDQLNLKHITPHFYLVVVVVVVFGVVVVVISHRTINKRNPHCVCLKQQLADHEI